VFHGEGKKSNPQPLYGEKKKRGEIGKAELSQAASLKQEGGVTRFLLGGKEG